MESASARPRRRPLTTGAIRMMPQVRYQGWTTGPRRTKASSGDAERGQHPHRLFVTQAVRGDGRRRQQAEESGDGQDPPETHADVDHVEGAAEMTSPTAVAGAIHERTASGVPRLAIQPQPRPETNDNAAMTARAMRPPLSKGRTRARQATSGTGPVPGHVDDADGRGDLDGGRQRAQHDPQHRMPVLGRGDAGHQQPDHDGVVVRASDEGQQGERVEQGHREGRARIAPVGPGQLGHAVGDERDPDHRHEAQQFHRDQGVVAAQRGRPAGQHQEEGPVGGGRVQPQGPDTGHVLTRADGARAVVVGVDVVAHHFALGRVGVDVLAEQRGHEQEGDDPEGQHAGQGADGRPRAVAQRLDQAEPDPDEQDHAAVDRHDAGQQQEGLARVALARVAEEPRPRQLGLERRARQGGADTDRHDGEEAQKGGAAAGSASRPGRRCRLRRARRGRAGE